MSVVLQKKASFFGVPLTIVRNVLRAWRYSGTKDAHAIAVRKDVKLNVSTVIILLDELRDRGLIGVEHQEYGEPIDGLTETGEAFVFAKGTRRTSKQKAQIILHEFLSRCSAVNNRDDLPFTVEKVWLFGSLINDLKQDVADIDFVPVLDLSANYNPEIANIRYKELAKEIGGDNLFQNVGIRKIFRLRDYVKNYFLYGGRKHPLLAPNDIDQLHSLGCPCKLIFDRQRGGIVDDPILPKHPDSKGRSKHLSAPGEMPDFTANKQSLRPLPINLTNSTLFHYASLMRVGPWPKDDQRYRLVQRKQGILVCLTADDIKNCKFCNNVITKRLNLSNLDARNKFSFIICDRKHRNLNDLEYDRVPSLGVIVKREIKGLASKIEYRLTVIDSAQKGKQAEYDNYLTAFWFIHFIASTDIEHVLRRESEASSTRKIKIIFKATSGNELAENLVSEFRSSTGLIAMERHFPVN